MNKCTWATIFAVTLGMQIVPVSAAPVSNAVPRGYETGFDTISRLTADLQQSLPRHQRAEVSPTPMLLGDLAAPCMVTDPAGGPQPGRTVRVSSGYVNLLNFMSHAKAIDEVNRGFFIKSLARLALEGGEAGPPDLQADTIRSSFALETMNRQASYFNQMAAGLIAIDMAHVSLGHYQKYATQLKDAQNRPVPINRLITPAEWRAAVVNGARHAIECGLLVEGLRGLFDGIDKMPVRPAWRIYFLPDNAEVGKINRELKWLQNNALPMNGR
jgi:hypothetical protein